MAIEEKKDGLFAANLGDGLIEVSDDAGGNEGTVIEDDSTKKNPEEKKEETPSPFTQHEDGTIEIDEHLQATIDAAPKPKEGEGEEDGTDIENIEKQKKQGKAPSDGDGSGDSSPSSSQYLAFARDRANEGVFLDFNEEDWKVLVERNEGDEAAALRELSTISVNQKIADQVEAYKDSLTEQERALYEAKEKGLPLDAFAMAKSNYDKYSKIKPEDIKDNEKLQIDVISKGLEVRGFSPEEIKEEIEGYKALEVLESKAEKVLPLLPKRFKGEIDNLEQAAVDQDKSRKDKIRQGVARMKQMVETTPEIIPGIKLNKPTREKIMKSMIEPVARDEAGNPLNPVMHTRTKNPDAFEMMVHYYHSLGLFNIDDNGQMKPDFSKISKIAKNEATDDMRSIFESKEKAVGGKPNVPKSEDKELDDFEKAFNAL